MAAFDHNGSRTRLEIERRDWLRVGGFVAVLVGLIMGAMMYVFQTRTTAIEEHAIITQAAALQKQKSELEHVQMRDQDKDVQKTLKGTQRILRTLDANQRVMMRDMEIPGKKQYRIPKEKPDE